MDHTPVAPERSRKTRRPNQRPNQRPSQPPSHRRRLRILVTVLLATTVLVAAGLIGYAATKPGPWKRTGPPIVVQAWAPFWQTDSALASFVPNSAVFGDLSMFAYHATSAAVVGPYDGFDPAVALTYRQAADAAGVSFTASIIDDTGKGAMAAILADPAARAVHVQTIAEFAASNEFDGIDLDYETFAFVDGRETWEATRPNWVLFVRELADVLHQAGRTLTVSVPPMYDPERTGGDRGYWVYDYESMGDVVDFIRIMAYDYNTAEAGPIAPIDWVRGLVADIKDMVPPQKLILGVPVYGYNWPTSILGICPIDQEPKRQNQSTKSAAALAASLGVVPTYDAERAESTFVYNEQLVGFDATGAAAACTVTRTVWYADAKAVHERAWLAQRQDLAGIAIWSLGSDDESVWQAIAAARASDPVWPAEIVPDVQPTSVLPTAVLPTAVLPTASTTSS